MLTMIPYLAGRPNRCCQKMQNHFFRPVFLVAIFLPGEVFFNSPHVPVRIDSVPADSLRLWDSSRVMPVIDAVIRYPSQASDFVQGKFLRHGNGPPFSVFIRVWLQEFWREKPVFLAGHDQGARGSGCGFLRIPLRKGADW